MSESTCGCPDYLRSAVSRRRVLQGAAAGLGLGAASTFGDAFRQVAYGAAPGGNVVVVLSLRGGSDGLSMVVPRGPDHDLLTGYRPSTVVPEGTLLGNDTRFGLHPAFAPLMPMWDAGRFAAIHAAGLPAPNRSHFQAMASIEEADPGSQLRVGWINRTIGLDPASGPTAGVQLGNAMLPTSLVGPAPALGADRLSNLTVPPLNNRSDGVRRSAINQVWGTDQRVLGNAVRSAMQTTSTLEAVTGAGGSARSSGTATRPAGGSTDQVDYTAYPEGPLRSVLSNTAALIRADVGTTMVTVDYGNWDMHAGMVLGDADPSRGWMHDQIAHLAGSLAAFFTDLGPAASRVTLVTISEFGRRVHENGDRGLDHGYGNAMLMLGAGVRGSGVWGRWPGLAPENLVDGDLALGTDYRSVLWEVVVNRFPQVTNLRETIFPGYGPEYLGFMAS